jgi:hypothetical protein
MSGNKRACKLEMALKSMQQKRNAVAESVNDKGNNHVWRGMGGSVSQGQEQRMNSDEKRRRRREEKAENLFHLIYWGPS